MINKKLLAVTVAAALAVSTATIFASGWQKNNTGWWFGTNDTNTTWHANGWQWLDGNGDGVAECYYFDANGYALTNTTTPDGYQVNPDGAWIVNSVVQTRQVSVNAVNSGSIGNNSASTGSNTTTSTNAASASTNASEYVKFEDVNWQCKQTHTDDGMLVKYLGLYQLSMPTNTGGIDIRGTYDIALRSDGKLHFSGHKYDAFDKVDDNTWLYKDGNTDTYLIMSDDGNVITTHFYINDFKNKGTDFGGLTYTRISQ